MNGLLYKILLVLILFLNHNLAKSQYRFTIEGKFNTDSINDTPSLIKDGNFVVLDFINMERKDTIFIKNKQFKIELDLQVPSIALINIESAKQGFGHLILLDNSTYQIDYQFKQSEQGNDIYSIQENVKTSSTFYNLWKFCIAKKLEYRNKKQEVMELMKYSSNEESRLLHEQELNLIETTYAKIFFDLSRKYAGTYEMTYLLPGCPGFTFDRYISFYDNLSNDVKNSFYGKNFYSYLSKLKSSKE